MQNIAWSRASSLSVSRCALIGLHLLLFASALIQTSTPLQAAEQFQLEDRFKTDSRANYRTQGDVQWSPLELMLPPGSALATTQVLDGKFVFEADIWPQPHAGGPATSHIEFLFTNGWAAVFRIVRVEENGRQNTQLDVTQLRLSSGEDPQVTHLRRSKPFVVNGDIEKWRIDYNYGLISVSCNGTQLITAYCGSFTSWLRSATVNPLKHPIALSRLRLDGHTAGYTPQQREHYNQIVSLRTKAEEAESLGEIEDAITFESQALELAHHCHPPTHPSNALFHQNIGQRLAILHRNQESKEQHDKATAILRQALGEAHPETLASSTETAELRMVLGEIDQAERDMRKAIAARVKIAGIGSENTKVLLGKFIRLLNNQGDISLAAGSYRAAQRYRKEALDVNKAVYGEDHPLTVHAAGSLQFVESILSAKGKRKTLLIEYLQTRGQITELDTYGRSAESAPLKGRLLEIARELFDDRDLQLVDALSLRAESLFQQGAVDRAISLQGEALQMLERTVGQEHPAYAQAVGQYGAQLSEVGRLTEATPLLFFSVQSLVEQGHEEHLTIAPEKVQLAKHLCRLGEHEQAGALLSEAHQALNRSGLYASAIALETYYYLAECLRTTGNNDEARVLVDYHKNLVASAFGEQSSAFIDALHTEARQLLAEKKLDEAVPIINRAVELADLVYGEHSRTHKRLVKSLIKAHLARSDMPAVTSAFERLLEHELYTRETLFNIYTEQQQVDRSMLDRYSLDSLIILALEGHLESARAYNHALAFKGVVTSRQRLAHIARHTPEILGLIEELDEVERKLAPRTEAVQPAAEAEDEEQRAAERVTLTARRAELNELLFQKSEAFRTAAARTDFTEIQSQLPPGTALVDYYEYIKPPGFFDRLFGRVPGFGLVAFVVPREGPPKMVDLGSVASIAELRDNWLTAMAAEPYYELTGGDLTLAELCDNSGAALRKRIWDPLADTLDGAKTVVISPSSSLTACPFAALPAASEGSFLIEEFAFATITTPRLLPELLRDRTVDEDADLLLVGDIDYDKPGAPKTRTHRGQAYGAFTKLRSGKRELKAIVNAYYSAYRRSASDHLTGRKAAESVIRDKISDRAYVHFHTHGFCFDITPKRTEDTEASGPSNAVLVSGIALSGANQGIYATENPESDGVLWSHEIQQLDLRQTKLVTLAACQTAIGGVVEGEGMLGTQRALHVAGARASLTALWSVLDRPTSELMDEFYSALWKDGLPKAEALQKAQVRLLRKHDNQKKPDPSGDKRVRTPPALWAAFILHGDWR